MTSEYPSVVETATQTASQLAVASRRRWAALQERQVFKYIVFVVHGPSLAGIGFNTVLNISIRKARSRLRGSTQALCITSKFSQSRFEFVFTSLVKNSPRLFTTVQAVLR